MSVSHLYYHVLFTTTEIFHSQHNALNLISVILRFTYFHISIFWITKWGLAHPVPNQVNALVPRQGVTRSRS